MERDEDELHRLFEACDSNGNGSLQYAEFCTLVRNLDAHIGDAECRVGFTEIDSDQDGHIDFGEFRRWWEEH